MYNPKSSKNVWVLALIMLAGIVIGGFLGQLTTNLADSVDFLSFLKALNYSQPFGLSSPVAVNLGVISFSFAFIINFSVWGIIGMIVAAIIYRKM